MTGYKDIDANTLFELLASHKLLLIDVRNDDEVARGTIPGAVHIPLAMLPVKHDALNDKLPTVFYCHSGIRSAQAAAFVASKDHLNVYNLVGGILAWGRAGYPFEPPAQP